MAEIQALVEHKKRERKLMYSKIGYDMSRIVLDFALPRILQNKKNRREKRKKITEHLRKQLKDRDHVKLLYVMLIMLLIILRATY